MIDGLIPFLAADEGIAAICGNRIYPVVLLENAPLPAMTVQVVGASSEPTFETSGMQRVRVQFDCRGMKHSDASGLRKALRACLDGYQGQLPNGGPYLQNAQWIQPIDYFDYDPRQYRCAAEFYLYFVLL